MDPHLATRLTPKRPASGNGIAAAGLNGDPRPADEILPASRPSGLEADESDVEKASTGAPPGRRRGRSRARS